MNDKILRIKKSTLVDIANEVRAKTGSTDLIKIADLDYAVKNISGGGGESVLIETSGGTIVPNSGTVEEIYFNTDLSEEEVINLLDKLTYTESVYIGLVTNSSALMFAKLQIEEELFVYAIMDEMNQTIYWCNEAAFNALGSEFGVTHSGWQEFDNPIEINAEVLSDIEGILVGSENDLLINVFSTTPFEAISKTLTGTYDGSSIKVNVNDDYFNGKKIDVEKFLEEQKLPLKINVEPAKSTTTDKKVELIGEYDGSTIQVTENVDMQTLIQEGKLPLSIEIPEPGLEINGLIKEYKVMAGTNLNAGDFVEYFNNVFKKLNSTSNSSYSAPSCILLEPNKVFIAHAFYNSGTYLYGTIVEIDGTTMTATTTQLNSEASSCNVDPTCCLLENNKVFIAHKYSSDGYLYGTIVTIDGTTMTATTTQLNTEVNSCYHAPSCILLEPNKVFIAHNYTSDCYLYGTIVTIDGTTMTATTTQLNSKVNSCDSTPTCCLLENNKVFIAHQYSSSVSLCGTIVTINGTTMTATTTQLNTDNFYGTFSCCLLETNKVFIAHTNSSMYLHGTIVTINGTTMTATTTQLNSEDNNCNGFPTCCLLEPNKVFIAHPYSVYKYLYGTIVTIDGTTMTATTTQLNSEAMYTSYSIPCCCSLENNEIFIAHNYSSKRYLYGTIYSGDCVKAYETTITGVAKTSGVSGDTIQVYVPNTAE